LFRFVCFVALYLQIYWFQNYDAKKVLKVCENSLSEFEDPGIKLNESTLVDLTLITIN